MKKKINTASERWDTIKCTTYVSGKYQKEKRKEQKLPKLDGKH